MYQEIMIFKWFKKKAEYSMMNLEDCFMLLLQEKNADPLALHSIRILFLHLI